MDFVCVCNHCGKTIQQNFIYCPWCGKQNLELNDESVLENVFNQLEAKQSNDRQTRVKKIETKIEEIEKGLDGLLNK